MVFQLCKVIFFLMVFHENTSDGFQVSVATNNMNNNIQGPIMRMIQLFVATLYPSLVSVNFSTPKFPVWITCLVLFLLVMILMISECWWNGLKMASDTAAVTLDTIWPLHTHNESKYFPYPVKISLFSPHHPIMRTIWLIAVVFTVFSFSAFLHPWHGDIIKLQGDLQ